MRLFIAAPLPDSILNAVESGQSQFNLPGVRLVPASNLHLTILFLGETPDAHLPGILDKVQQIANDQTPFELKFKEIAPGPKINSPRLVWVRFEENNAFEMLGRAIHIALPETGKIHPDFIPHVTIARIKKEKLNGANLPVINNAHFPDYLVQKIAVWQSVLGIPHPHYSILAEFPLAQP